MISSWVILFCVSVAGVKSNTCTQKFVDVCSQVAQDTVHVWLNLQVHYTWELSDVASGEDGLESKTWPNSCIKTGLMI